jgi:hypothetical protein
MATRGAIGIRNEDGTVTGIYSHWDNYPSYNGRILLDHYDHTKTRKLLSLGAVSCLAKEIGQKHDFSNSYKPEDPEYQWCRFYTRDRGDDFQPSITFSNEDEFVKHFTECWADYFYLLEECGTWFVTTGRKEWQRVDQVLAEEESKELHE